MKRKIVLLAMLLVFTSGCNQLDDLVDRPDTINLVSRESGSGTRTAFVEILEILIENDSGYKNDNTSKEAIIQNGTNAIMTTVEGDRNAIGYISLGSLNDRVKALNIDGIEARVENLQDGSYKISRPFNIAMSSNSSELAFDFENFILSSQGQTIVAEEGYVEVGQDLKDYEMVEQEGILTVAGSTSVSPLMEKLAEAYEKLQSQVSIEIQSTGSSAGIQSVMEGNADMGMASRSLKDSEKENLIHGPIAIDGIVVIVNKENPRQSLSIDLLRSIYSGEIDQWDDLEDN